MEDSIAIYDKEGALSVQDLRKRVNLIQEVMGSIMKEDEHYGVIPGCGKPSLYKSGAELLASTFQISMQSEDIEDLSTDTISRYRVTVKAYYNGKCIGSSVGVCSSGEEKYKWKKPVCDEEWEETDSAMRREKWFKGGGTPYKGKQIRTQPADLDNTILQMADKRGYVSVVRKVTAASDVFTQDIEDMPEMSSQEGEPDRPAPKSSTVKKKAAPVSSNEITGLVEQLDVKKGNTKGKDWTRYGIKVDGNFYTSFSDTDAKIAKDANALDTTVTIVFEQHAKGRNVKSISISEIEVAAETVKEKEPEAAPVNKCLTCKTVNDCMLTAEQTALCEGPF